MFVRISLVVTAIGALALASEAKAQFHAGDVIVDVVDNKVQTGDVNEQGQPQFPWYVWSENLGSAGVPHFSADPGFDSVSGAFTPGHTVGLAIRKALRVWDTEEEHFHVIPELETLEISRFQNFITTPAVDPAPGDPLPSLPLGFANSSGSIHIHPNYFLNEPHGNGVYLVELEFWVNTEGVAPSDPFWIVFNQNEPQAVVADAVAWVEDNLVNPACPGDLNSDGVIDVSDLLILLGAWGENPGHAADLNGDGVVDVSDLLLMLGAWGVCS